MELIFEISKSGRAAGSIPASDVPAINIQEIIGENICELNLICPKLPKLI
jgi:hypothetical protein